MIIIIPLSTGINIFILAINKMSILIIMFAPQL